MSTVMPKVKKEGLGSLSKSERQKLQRLYTQGFAAYGSVRNVAKAAKLSPLKVREFLHSKTSYTRFTQATRKFERMRAFARFKNEIWSLYTRRVMLKEDYHKKRMSQLAYAPVEYNYMET